MPELRFSFDLDADDVASALGTKDTVALATACLQQLGSSEQHEAIRSALPDTELRSLFEALRADLED